ncbi:MAG: hypothetical protein ACX930_14695 [Erythrobacter sp.]
MRTQLPAIAAALTASLALAACTAEPAPTGEDDLPETQIDGDPDAISGEAIEEAVPGVEEASPEGETSTTADLQEAENAEYTDVGEPPEAGDRD